MPNRNKRFRVFRPSSPKIIGSVQKSKVPLPATAKRIVECIRPLVKLPVNQGPRRFKEKIIYAIKHSRLTAKQRSVLLQRLNDATISQIAKARGITNAAVRDFETRELKNVSVRLAHGLD